MIMGHWLPRWAVYTCYESGSRISSKCCCSRVFGALLEQFIDGPKTACRDTYAVAMPDFVLIFLEGHGLPQFHIPM